MRLVYVLCTRIYRDYKFYQNTKFRGILLAWPGAHPFYSYDLHLPSSYMSKYKMYVDSGMQCILSGNNDGKTDHPSVHSHSQAGVSTLAPAPAWPGPEYCITHQLDLARFSRHMKTNTIWYYGSWVSWGDRDCDHLCFYREGFNLWKNCVNLITNTTTTILNLFFQIVLSWLGAHFLVCLLLDEKSGEWVAMLASVVSSGGQRSVQFGFELLISCTSALWGVLYPPSAHQAIDRILLGALEILFLLTLIH